MDNTLFKVSLILPTYNRGNVINESVKSVISQTYENWELIISDDASNDRTSEICQELARQDHRIKYYRNENNLGLPRNRNAALSKVNGDLILFTEDDMVLDKKCVEFLLETYEILRKKGTKVGGICPAMVTNHIQSSSKRNVLNFVKDNKDDKLSNVPCIIDKKTGIIYRNFSPQFEGLIEVEDCHSCSLYPRNIFNEFKYEENAYKGTYTGEESDLHFRIRKKGHRLYFQPKAIMHHHVEEQGGCRLPLYQWSYYFVRNHVVFLNRNYGYKSLIMIPNYLFFGLKMIFNFYFRGKL